MFLIIVTGASFVLWTIRATIEYKDGDHKASVVSALVALVCLAAFILLIVL